MNKSLATNLISIALIGIGFISPLYPDHILTIGLFATSGAITNWLAIHMLFEKIPGLYGSGVIPNRFEEFKVAIHDLMMQQFFTPENVEGFFTDQIEEIKHTFDPEPAVEAIDFDQAFASLVDVVINSPFGTMLSMVGGPSALQPLREPFILKMRQHAFQTFSSPLVLDAVQHGFDAPDRADEIIEKVDQIVIKRLNELTPDMVKKIIQDMIRTHLGWLVVWGGVFGGLIGFVTSFLI